MSLKTQQIPLRTHYSNFLKDGKFLPSKLSIAFIKPSEKTTPNIIVDIVKDQKNQIFINDDNKIKINIKQTHKQDSTYIANQILKAIDEATNIKDFICYLHSDMNTEHIAQTCVAEYYAFDIFKSESVKKPKNIQFICNNDKDADNLISRVDEIKLIGQLSAVLQYLNDMPSNYLQPSDMAAIAQSITHGANNPNFTVELIDADTIKKHMGALYSVGQASNDPSQMILLKWMPKKGAQQPIAIAGKGITFDTGGLSLKSPTQMIGMKHDMMGAANAMMIVYAAAQLNLDINVITIMACAENDVSSSATRPGDVVSVYPRTTKNASTVNTIEVLNTDAEGRLVLADAIAYIQEKYNPSAVIDIATLTGAIVVSLGKKFSGLFSNNHDLTCAIQAAANHVNQRVWHLPSDDYLYGDLLDSPIADIANIPAATSSVTPGSIVAAVFLQKFIDAGRPWAHLDIAGSIDECEYSSFQILLQYLKNKCK